VDASHRAIALAQASGHHEVARRAAENAAWQYLFGLRDLTQAARWVGVAEQLDSSAAPSPRELALRDIVRAHVDEQAGDLDGAVTRLQAVDARVRAQHLDAEPAVRALEGLVLMVMRARRWQDAAAWLDRLERDHPDDARARFVVARQRGTLALIENRPADAAPLLARAAELAPAPRERASALVSLGEALAGQGHLDGPGGALARFDQGAAADPEGADGPVAIDALCARAHTLHRARRWDQALLPLTRCLEAREARFSARAPVVIYTMVELGTLHDAQGRRDLAIDYLTRALDRFAAIGRDDASVQAVRDRLARLKQR
jgi:tetratricopeptide (TPR) repeat protein